MKLQQNCYSLGWKPCVVNFVKSKTSVCLIALLFILSRFNANASTNGTWGLPDYLWINSASIEDYPGSDNDLPRSHDHKVRFVNGIYNNITSKGYAIEMNNIDYQDANATTANYISRADECEIVCYFGHGNTPGPWMYDGYLTADMKSFGSWTKWVFHDACLTMNVGLTDMEPRFNGMHAIYGYASLGWQFNKWSWSCFCMQYSEEVWSNFANRWVKNGEGMWNAYRSAIEKEMVNDGGHDVEIRSFYLQGTVAGQFIDGNEVITNVYRDWLLPSEVDGIMQRGTVWGNPNY